MSSHLTKARLLLNTHSPAILTACAVIGVAGAVYSASRASFKAGELIAERTNDLNWDTIEMEDPITEIDLEEKIKLVWKLFIPTGILTVSTIASIILLNQVGVRKAAAAAALYTVTEQAFSDYRERVVENHGEKTDQKMKDEAAQHRITVDPPEDKSVVIAAGGDVLCMDSMTGRYFESDIETIRQAQNNVNQLIIHDMYAPLAYFYEEIGLPTTPMSHQIGWNTDRLLDISFSTCLTEDNRPCIYLDYVCDLTENFSRIM